MTSQFYTHMTISKVALDDYLETWIEAFLIDRKAQNLSRNSLLFYRDRLNRLLEFAEIQAITKVSHLTPDVIRRYLLWLDSTGHNAGGCHACYRALRAFILWWWQEVDAEGKPPTSKIRAPKVALEPLQPVELDHVEALIKTCDKSIIGLRDRAIFLTLLDTGCRARELLAIDFDDIDLMTGSVTVKHSKNGKSRNVYLSQPTRRAIRAYLKVREDDNQALFISDAGSRFSYSGMNTMLKRRAKMARIPHVELHDFRRAFALACLRNGMNVFALQSLLGHSDMQVVKRYLAQTQSDLRQAHDTNSPVSNLKIR